MNVTESIQFIGNERRIIERRTGTRDDTDDIAST